MPQAPRAVGVAERIESVLQEIDHLGVPQARERTEEVARTLMEFYGAGLRRLLDIVYDETGETAPGLFDKLGRDSLVSSLLLLHDLHPLDLAGRVEMALESVRPFLKLHGGNVTLLSVEDGVPLLRLEGSCNGCPSSTVTMKQAVERAIEEAAPEVERIEVEGMVPARSPSMPWEQNCCKAEPA